MPDKNGNCNAFEMLSGKNNFFIGLLTFTQVFLYGADNIGIRQTTKEPQIKTRKPYHITSNKPVAGFQTGYLGSYAKRVEAIAQGKAVWESLSSLAQDSTTIFLRVGITKKVIFPEPVQK
jgi:hypothetical protein